MSNHEYIPVKLSLAEKLMQHIIQHYNPEKYWRYRAYAVDPIQRSFLVGLKQNIVCFVLNAWMLLITPLRVHISVMAHNLKHSLFLPMD